jgi:uroporphyrin-III C-methyltransferase
VTVYLVGAGPGDPQLLTLRAARLLAHADVVVHDALVSPAILELARPDAEMIDVGKRAGRSSTQPLINALLVELGHTHACVVRLKGGDPLVFGRGGEESVALTDAGIDHEIIPGISSAFAAPAAAGIPVTHRGISGAVTVITGHRQPGEADIDWHALARVGGTIVVLMGVERRASIAEALMSGGLPADTPVAAIERATTSTQSVVRTTLAILGAQHIATPAVLIIGAVAALNLTAPELHSLVTQ